MICYKIDKGSGVAAYLQLYRYIREDITKGIYKYGDRLPSKRLMAEETGVSVITVQHALELLTDEGYVTAKNRSGFYVAYRRDTVFAAPSEEKADMDNDRESPAAHADVFDEDAKRRIEDFPFSSYMTTMRKTLSKYQEAILVRSPNAGVSELREALAAYLARSRGMVVGPHQIVIGSGAEYLYSLIVQMLGRDRLYAVESPSYSQIERVYRANGASIDPLKMGTNGILSSELMRTKASVLHITPFHSYPTGVTADASKRHEYISWARQRGAVIVEDDVDSEFTISTKTEETVFSLEPTHTVIYMNTFSRTMYPAMRIGYMVLPYDLRDQLIARIDFYSCTVPVYDQYVLTEFINSGDFERHINRIRRKNRR